MTGTHASVPAWLVAMVVALLAGVTVAAIAVVQELQVRPQYSSAAEMEVAHLEEAVVTDPQDAAARIELAFAYHRAARLDEALVVYGTLLEERPDDVVALYGAGLVNLETGSVAEGERMLLTVLRHEPGHVHAATVLGTLYAEQGRYRDVLAVVEPAAEHSIGIADLCLLMGLAHENLGDAERAAECFENALGYIPDMEEARDALSRMGVNQ